LIDTPCYRASGAKKPRTEGGTRGRPLVVSDSDAEEEEAPRRASAWEKLFREHQPRLERAEQALSTLQYMANAGMWLGVQKVLAEYRAGPSGIQQGGQIQADGLMVGSEEEEEEEENGGGGGNNPSVPQLTPAGGGPAVPPLGLRRLATAQTAQVGKSACVVIMTLLMPRVVHPEMLTVLLLHLQTPLPTRMP
jgi:hypothetical protein